MAICKKEGRNLEDLWAIVDLLVEDGRVPVECGLHELKDKYAGCLECHIDDDWVLVWQQDDNRLTLLMTTTGTHEYVFGKH